MVSRATLKGIRVVLAAHAGLERKTTPVAFEPARGDPIGLACERLSRSACAGISSSVSEAAQLRFGATQILLYRVAPGLGNGAGVFLSEAPDIGGLPRAEDAQTNAECPWSRGKYENGCR